jgi:hypothetical protein
MVTRLLPSGLAGSSLWALLRPRYHPCVTSGTRDEVDPPALAEFLAAPDEVVAAVMPATVVFASGGTRRSAALSGIPSHSDDYARHQRERMVACFDRFFRLGVRNLVTCVVRPGQFDEVGRYRDKLLRWIDWGIGGPEALADYARFGWRVRLSGVEAVPELRELGERLIAATPPTWQHTLWLYGAADRGSLWEQTLAVAHATKARNQTELIRALLGEEIPTAGLWIGFGKPMMTQDIVPLALIGETQCYWMQRPGYDIDESMIRRIVYDCVYRRQTWRKDKSTRYADIEQTRSIWESPRVLGIGRRAGGFWYFGDTDTEFGDTDAGADAETADTDK